LDGSIATASFDRPPPKRKPQEPWPVLPPGEAIDLAIPFLEILRQGVRAALYKSLAHGVYLPVRAALGEGQPLPVSWYGQQEAHWIAYYDTCAQLGLARYTPADDHHLDDWATLARSCGWWWPGEDTCVVADRPTSVHIGQIPGTWHGEVRLHRDNGPAIEFRDGWHPQLR
jgi:hypothetical protein